MCRAIMQWSDSIDVLVNNASSFSPTSLLGEHRVTEDQWNSLMDSNLKGPFFIIQELLDGLALAASKSGRNPCIINIVDIMVQRPQKNFGVYIAAKAGLEALTRTLSVDLGSMGIRANAVAPGAILWPEGDATFTDDQKAETLSKIPLRRLGSPLAIAQAVKFLVENNYMNGATIRCDGGASVAF